MKTTVVIVFICLLVLQTNAQGNRQVTNQTPSQTLNAPNVGSLIARLTTNISPSAFTPEFLKNKKGWEEKAKTVNDPKGASWLLKSLESGLKSSALKAEWVNAKGPWLNAVNSLKTVKDATQPLQALAANMDSSNFEPQWENNKNDWNTALSAIHNQ